jgi:hypothetical protein
VAGLGGWMRTYRIVASSFLPGHHDPAARALLPPGDARCGGGLVGSL